MSLTLCFLFSTCLPTKKLTKILAMFSHQNSDIIRNYEEEKTEVKKSQESAEDIKNRMIEKGLKLSGTKL